MVLSLDQRFWSRLEKTSTCWIWKGAIWGHHGPQYGRISYRGAWVQAHRFSYELLVGPIPKGLTIDHVCKNTLCVNPLHLRPLSLADNIRRGVGTGTENWNGRKTQCPRGHPYSGENLYIGKSPDGYIRRFCKTCQKEYAKRKLTRV